MSRKWTLALAGMLTAALAIFVALRLEVTTDVAELLPDVADRQLAAVSQTLADSSLTRTMILVLAAHTPEQARQAAHALRQKLAVHPEVEFVESGPDPRLEQAAWALYFPHRFGLTSLNPQVELPEMLSESGMQAAATELKHQLQLPTAPLVKKLAPADPWLTFLRQMKRLEAAQPGGVQVVDGQFMTANGQRALVFLVTRHSALDGDFQQPLLEALDAEIVGLQQHFGPHLGVQMSGINRLAAKSRADIELDVARISTISTLALLVLFVLLFRSLWLILLAQLPIAFGLLAGAAATIAVFGQVHGLTLAFGATLIGVCIDYPIHFLNHHTLAPHPEGPRAGLKRLWTGLWLGALTTIAGFAALGASSYPGIRQVAVFASVGIAGALLATAWWLPLLVPAQPPAVAFQQHLAHAIAHLFAGLRARRRLVAGLLIGSVLVALGGLPFLHWHDEVADLNALDPALQAEDQAVRAQVSSLEPGQVVVIQAPTEELLLQRSEIVSQQLEKLVAAHKLGSFQSASRFVWAAQLQQQNLAAWQQFSPDRFREVWTQAGFRPEVFQPFLDQQTKPPPPLTWKDLQQSPFQPLTRIFRAQLAGQPALLTFLAHVHDALAVRAAVETVGGTHFFDQRAFVNAAYEEYRSSTWLLILLGIVAIFALIAVQYRSLRLTVISSLPAVVAGLATLSLLSICGESLNLLHLVGFVIVLCIGVDYGVYLAETAIQHEHEPATALSILISALSTVLAFGLLGLSHNPALHAIGLTTGLGVLWSLVLAPTLLLLTEKAVPK